MKLGGKIAKKSEKETKMDKTMSRGLNKG